MIRRFFAWLKAAMVLPEEDDTDLDLGDPEGDGE